MIEVYINNRISVTSLSHACKLFCRDGMAGGLGVVVCGGVGWRA